MANAGKEGFYFLIPPQSKETQEVCDVLVGLQNLSGLINLEISRVYENIRFFQSEKIPLPDLSLPLRLLKKTPKSDKASILIYVAGIKEAIQSNLCVEEGCLNCTQHSRNRFLVH